MKTNLRRTIWTLALATTVGILGAPQFAAAYQSDQRMEQDRGNDRDRENDRDRNNERGNVRDFDRNNPNFNLGWQHGQDDSSHNRNRQFRLRLRNDWERRAYEAGYNQGYQDFFDRNRRGGNNGWGRGDGRNGGQYGRIDNIARQAGMQDGYYEGENDLRTGHSNRPTWHSKYKNATRGYNSSYGYKDQYKMAYRQGFLEGYQRGYQQGFNGRGGYYPRR